MNEAFDSNSTISEDGQPDNYKQPRAKDELGSFIDRFIKIIIIHKWLFLIVTVCIILLVVLSQLRQPKLYQSNYEVFYNENLRELVQDNNTTVVKSDFDKNYWLKAMQSDELMALTIHNSGLKYSEGRLKDMITVNVANEKKEDRIPVFLVQIIAVNKDHIPILIRAYIKSLNQLLTENQVHNSERLISYLNDQINTNNQKLNTIDIQINRDGFGGPNNEIVDFDKVKSTLDDFRKDLLNSRVNLSSITSSRKRTEKELQKLDGTIVNESAFSEPLKVQLMNLEVDLARALTKNKEAHPAVIQIKKNIQQISQMLKDSLEQRLEIKSLIQNPLKSQLMGKLLDLQIQEVSEDSRVKSLEQVISELEKKTMPTSVNQDQQQQLRNREMLDLTIKQLNDKLLEAQSTSHGCLSRFVFIDDPSAIRLLNKSIWFYLILAIALALLLASIVVFIYDVIDDRIMIVEDYERFYNYPLLGTIRHYSGSERNSIDSPSEYKSGTFNDIGGLVVRIRQVIKHNHIKTVLITSPNRQEGKSLVSMKVASALAIRKQNILLVDMDFFVPKLTANFCETSKVGLSNFLMDEVSIDDIIHQTEIECLKFVSAGNAEGQKGLFYNDSRLSDFIETVSDQFDVIIFDTPAAMYIPDIVELFELMDGIFIIARLRRTTRKLLDKILKITKGFRLKYIGVIINDLQNGKNHQYSYDYDYKAYSQKDNEKKIIK